MLTETIFQHFKVNKARSILRKFTIVPLVFCAACKRVWHHAWTLFMGAHLLSLPAATDVRGKIVEAVSPSGLGGYTMQAHEMMKDNVLVIQDALQVH